MRIEQLIWSEEQLMMYESDIVRKTQHKLIKKKNRQDVRQFVMYHRDAILEKNLYLTGVFEYTNRKKLKKYTNRRMRDIEILSL